MASLARNVPSVVVSLERGHVTRTLSHKPGFSQMSKRTPEIPLEFGDLAQGPLWQTARLSSAS